MANQKKKSPARTLVKVLVILLCVVFLILNAGRFYFRLPVLGYYGASEKAFRIPGLWEGFVPQGLSYDRESDSFLVTGYRKDKTASPVYVVSRGDGKQTGMALLTAPDGTAPEAVPVEAPTEEELREDTEEDLLDLLEGTPEA